MFAIVALRRPRAGRTGGSRLSSRAQGPIGKPRPITARGIEAVARAKAPPSSTIAGPDQGDRDPGMTMDGMANITHGPDCRDRHARHDDGFRGLARGTVTDPATLPIGRKATVIDDGFQGADFSLTVLVQGVESSPANDPRAHPLVAGQPLHRDRSGADAGRGGVGRCAARRSMRSRTCRTCRSSSRRPMPARRRRWSRTR